MPLALRFAISVFARRSLTMVGRIPNGVDMRSARLGRAMVKTVAISVVDGSGKPIPRLPALKPFTSTYFFEAVAAFLAACHFFIVAESLFLAAVLIFRWGLPADTVVCGCCPTGRAFRDAPVRPGVWFRSSASSCSILAFSASSPLIASSMSLLFCIMKPPSYRSLTYVGFFIG